MAYIDKHILKTQIANSGIYRPLLKECAAELLGALNSVNACPGPIYPPSNQLLRAFELTQQPRAIILGQDPYPTAGHADGLAFSCSAPNIIPASLKAIFACLVKQNLMPAPPQTANLTPWAERGILLLNIALTVESGKAASHINIWSPFAKKIIVQLAKAFPACPFILFGRIAQSYAPEGATTLNWGHPSPLNRINNKHDDPAAFINCPHFAQIPIDWSLNSAAQDTTTYLDIFTDGSCIKQGEVSGWAYIVVQNNKAIHKNNGILPAPSSNNKGELRAIVEALKYAQNSDAPYIRIFTDSQYSQMSITVWYNNWINQSGGLVGKKNIDLVSEAHSIYLKLSPRVQIHHIRGHQNNGSYECLWNDEADKLCSVKHLYSQ